MELIPNPHFSGAEIPAGLARHVGADAPARVKELLACCPVHRTTPLRPLETLAAELGLGRVLVKDESRRLGLNSFKALGGVYAVFELAAREAERVLGRSVQPGELLDPAVRAVGAGMTFVCASDGNHGRAVAAGAKLFGARCIVFLHAGVSAGRARMITDIGATVIRTSGSYDDSVDEAAATVREHGWVLVSDTAASSAEETPGLIMRGYSVIADEILAQLAEAELPTHVFVQAGVGGLAGAMAGHLASRLGSRAPIVVVVEPARADCLLQSCKAGRAVELTQADSTVYAMLECLRPSALAWEILRDQASFFLSVGDETASRAVLRLGRPGAADPAIEVAESGAAGMAGLLAACERTAWREQLGLSIAARVLLIATESSELRA